MVERELGLNREFNMHESAAAVCYEGKIKRKTLKDL